MLKDEYKVYEEKMRKSIDSVAADFAAVRAGRANAAVLDRISVDYYGTPTPIQQIASIGSPDPRQLLIQPWDASAVKLIEKAILNSDLGINPQNDGKAIRLTFPQLTEERRKELVKQIRKYAEGGKVAIRRFTRPSDRLAHVLRHAAPVAKHLRIPELRLRAALLRRSLRLSGGIRRVVDFRCGCSDRLFDNIGLRPRRFRIQAQATGNDA